MWRRWMPLLGISCGPISRTCQSGTFWRSSQMRARWYFRPVRAEVTDGAVQSPRSIWVKSFHKVRNYGHSWKRNRDPTWPILHRWILSQIGLNQYRELFAMEQPMAVNKLLFPEVNNGDDLWFLVVFGWNKLMYFGRLPRILSCIFKIQVLQDRGTPRGKIGFSRYSLCIL